MTHHDESAPQTSPRKSPLEPPQESNRIEDAAPHKVSRQKFLRTSGLTVGAAALLPLAGVGGEGLAGSVDAQAARPISDPDELFRLGRFKEADRAYRRLLRKNPENAHALARRGYIALLSNEFETAKAFLTRAIELAPDDTFSKLQLANTFVRQDQLAPAVPLLQGLGETEQAWAVTYASISGTPYDVHGADSTTVPLPALDPLPHFELSVNGMEPQRFMFDTGGGPLNLTKETAERAGLVGLATSHTFAAGQQLALTHGVAPSIRIGEVELRNVPVTWADFMVLPELPDGTPPAGFVGNDIFYRFLTTLDYAGRSLVLRRKTKTELQRFQAKARRAGAEVLPLWLADHLACTLGSLNDYGPRVVLLDSGAAGFGFISIERFARASGIELGDPGQFGLYEVVAEEISLGDAVGLDMPGLVRPDSCPSGQCVLPPDLFPFEVICAFTHEFYKPFAVTFDFVDMNLYITGDLR
jgi:Aspartyl protease/Tetratricopeptide repeat